MSPSPFGSLRLIVDPSGGGGAPAAALPALTDALTGRGLAFDVVEVGGSVDAGDAARGALREGVRYLGVVGGDGAVHAVVNALFPVHDDQPRPAAPDAVLAVAAPKGCDFIRTFGLDRRPDIIARHLDGAAVMEIDVGVVRCARPGGGTVTRVFANVAQVGYGADLLRRADRLPRVLGRVRYLLGAYGAIAAARRPETPVVVDRSRKALPLVDLVVANGQFFQGGMKVAPRALPDDGKLNTLVFHGGASQVFQLTTPLSRGEHLPSPEITEYQSPTVEVAPDPPLAVEADGQVLGITPASFWLLPRTLRLKI